MRIKFSIQGDPKTKKNSIRIVKCGAYHKALPSKAYCDYEKEFVAECNKRNMKWKLSGKYNVKCSYFMQTKRKVDLVNLLNATCDCLVKAEVIQDDNSKIIASHDGSRVFYDKENPRVEIEITECN